MDAEIDARQQTGEITAKSWNSNDQEIAEATGNTRTIATSGNLSAADLARTASPSTYELKHGGQLPDGELNAWSSAEVQKQRLAHIRGRIRCRGTHLVRPGDTIDIGGLSDRFNGRVYTTAVQHFVAAGDWQTDLQFGMDPAWFADQHKVSSSPAAALVPSVSGLQTGVVTDIQDPLGEERIRINLPMVSPSGEGIWARQARPDAGPNRGMLFRPEIGDEVIVGFLDEDPRYPVIIGSVHSSANQAPLPVGGDNPEKGVVTLNGLKLIFDDPGKSVMIETPAGRKFTLSDETGKITVTDGIHSIEITDEGISLNSAGSISITAATELKLEAAILSVAANSSVSLGGSAGVEIESGGVLTLKGSLVKIN
jgi:Rhs element Vgr protein